MSQDRLRETYDNEYTMADFDLAPRPPPPHIPPLRLQRPTTLSLPAFHAENPENQLWEQSFMKPFGALLAKVSLCKTQSPKWDRCSTQDTLFCSNGVVDEDLCTASSPCCFLRTHGVHNIGCGGQKTGFHSRLTLVRTSVRAGVE